MPARDAAIHKCVNEAQARYPNVRPETTMRARTDVYSLVHGGRGPETVTHWL